MRKRQSSGHKAKSGIGGRSSDPKITGKLSRADSVTGLMSVGQLAKLLVISSRGVGRFKASGKLPKHVNIGRSVRWKIAEILAWIDANCPSQSDWEAMKRKGVNL